MRRLIALYVGLVLVLGAGAAWATMSQGDNSCGGGGACIGNTGDIGDDSCNAASACGSNTGEIGDDSCNKVSACSSNKGESGDDSCSGVDACQSQNGDIGDGSCNDTSACQSQGGSIGSGICNFPFGCFGSSQDRTSCLGGGMAVSGAVEGFDSEIDIPGCWFVGEPGESCATVCQQHGFAYDEATSTVAGSDLEICQAILGDGLPTEERSCETHNSRSA